MCMVGSAVDSIKSSQQKAEDMSAADVPLGDGLAHQARLTILQRRAQLQAAEGAANGKR